LIRRQAAIINLLVEHMCMCESMGGAGARAKKDHEFNGLVEQAVQWVRTLKSPFVEPMWVKADMQPGDHFVVRVRGPVDEPHRGVR
jgi:hypothetical protein